MRNKKAISAYCVIRAVMGLYSLNDQYSYYIAVIGKQRYNENRAFTRSINESQRFTQSIMEG